MHRVEEGAGIERVFGHEPGQRCAMLAPVGHAQGIGFGVWDMQRVHDKLRHPLLDLIE